jgi:hypothetical protein
MDGLERHVAHGLEEACVLGVDVDLSLAVRPGGDLAQHRGAARHPRPEVGDGVLGRPALLEVAGLLGRLGRDPVDEGVQPVPGLCLAGKLALVDRCLLGHAPMVDRRASARASLAAPEGAGIRQTEVSGEF